MAPEHPVCLNSRNSEHMNRPIVESSEGITLVGGGPVTKALMQAALARAPRIVGVDGGADRVLRLGYRPEAVVGDLDSLSSTAREQLADRLFLIPEQITTDFDKALRSVSAPFVLALGFVGARIDHGLAVLTALAAHPDRACLVLGPQDVMFHAPPQMDLSLRAGDRFSLFPMARVSGQSRGLDWPLDGLDFAPDGMIGTSNRVSTGPVQVTMDGPGMLAILPRARLDAAITALRSAPCWPPRPSKPDV